MSVALLSPFLKQPLHSVCSVLMLFGFGTPLPAQTPTGNPTVDPWTPLGELLF